MYRLTIDLASKKCGVCVSWIEPADNAIKIQEFHTWTLPNFTKEKPQELMRFFCGKLNHLLLPSEIGIELTNFKNAGVSNLHNFVLGVLQTCFWVVYGNLDIKIKIYNSNAWQLKLMNSDDTRAVRKQKAIDFCLLNGWSVNNDDEADAICANIYYDKIKTTYESVIETKEKRQAKQNKLKQELRDMRKQLKEFQRAKTKKQPKKA